MKRIYNDDFIFFFLYTMHLLLFIDIFVHESMQNFTLIRLCIHSDPSQYPSCHRCCHFISCVCFIVGRLSPNVVCEWRIIDEMRGENESGWVDKLQMVLISDVHWLGCSVAAELSSWAASWFSSWRSELRR